MGTFGRLVVNGHGQPVVVEESSFGLLTDKIFPKVKINKLDKVLKTMGVDVNDPKTRIFGAADFERDDKTRR
jgi:hypothetical protein